jgi:hypothetical protein
LFNLCRWSFSLSLPVMPMMSISGKSGLPMVGLHTGIPHRLMPLLRASSFRQYDCPCIIEYITLFFAKE